MAELDTIPLPMQYYMPNVAPTVPNTVIHNETPYDYSWPSYHRVDSWYNYNDANRIQNDDNRIQSEDNRIPSYTCENIHPVKMEQLSELF